MRTYMPWFATASLSVCVFCPTRCVAQDQQDNQDVAAAARQEKARKPAEAKTQSHVYTNDDLQKPQILSERDRARVEARKKSVPPPQTLEPAPSLDANGDSPAESLGEVARRYRREKAAEAAERANRPKAPAPFPMDLSQPTFAMPAPVGPPLSAPHAPLPPIPPSTAAPKPSLGRSSLRRDPFSRPAPTPSLHAPNSGAAPLFVTPAQPPAPAARPAEPTARKQLPITPPSFAIVPTPARPSMVSPPPTMRGIAPSKRTMVSPAAPSRPPVAPASSGLPGSSANSRITVEPGVSLWSLSRHFLGAGSRWQEWLSANPGLADPRLIHPGTTLVVPRTASGTPDDANLKVLVQQGDSLWKIAVNYYRNGAEWQCIAAANPSVLDSARIYPGQELVLPASCGLSQPSKVSR